MFEKEKLPGGFEHPAHFVECTYRIGNDTGRSGAEDCIELLLRKRKGFSMTMVGMNRERHSRNSRSDLLWKNVGGFDD